MQGAVAPRAVLVQLGQSHLGELVVVGQRAEGGRVAQAAVGKGVAGARAAPRRWMMVYLHSVALLLSRMRETFYRTVLLHGANTVVELGRGGPFISMFIVVRMGLSRNVKKCLNSSRVLTIIKEFLYVSKNSRTTPRADDYLCLKCQYVQLSPLRPNEYVYYYA